MSRYQQPTYDFLAGAEPSPQRNQRQAQVEAFKQSTVSRADHGNEDLRAQLRTLQYELDSLKQERELATLEQQQQMRDTQARGESDYKRAVEAERARDAAVKRADALAREAQDAQDRAANEKAQVDRKIRGLQEDNRQLREEVEEIRAEEEEKGRELVRKVGELEERLGRVKQGEDEAGRDLQQKVDALQAAQKRLGDSELQVGELEKEVLRLKAQTGDADTLALIKKELGDQVEYIRRLEGINREQATELKGLRRTAKSVEVVEEEKRGLEAKVRIMEDLRRELSEAQLQRRILEDEKAGWTSYLDTEGAKDEVSFETPEQMARAFLQERLERLSLVDKLGSVQPELNVKEESIRSLQDDKAKLQSELDALRTTASAAPAAPNASDMKARARLERQKNLAVKEVDYLRAQMKTFEAEEAEFNSEQIDEAHTKRVHELEEMLTNYRTELQTLHADLTTLEKSTSTQQPPQNPLSSPKKRTHSPSDSDERLGEMRRKLNTLQSDLSTSHSRIQVLEASLKASQSHLSTLQASSRTRTLELRSNPTADYFAIKQETLTTLRAENSALLSLLENPPHGPAAAAAQEAKVVPISTLASARLQITELQSTIAQLEKKHLRLRQIFTTKSLEFREAVASILGWKLDFQPNGRVKCTSVLYPTQTDAEGEEVENAITFDGEQGTMKVSGGPRSVFAGEIRESVEFWVEGRGGVPGLLAALTLEFYERQAEKGGK